MSPYLAAVTKLSAAMNIAVIDGLASVNQARSCGPTG